jgi:hypothetical protein
VRQTLSPDEEKALSRQLRRFDDLSSTGQEAELDRIDEPDSPWRGYLSEYGGFGLATCTRWATTPRLTTRPCSPASSERSGLHSLACETCVRVLPQVLPPSHPRGAKVPGQSV